MEFSHPQARSYLQELFSVTSGNPDSEVSMYDIGSVIGLERSEAGVLAEELIVEGLMELRSLSGGVSITALGIQAIDMQVSARSGEEAIRLGGSPVLSAELQAMVEGVLGDVQKEISALHLSYEELEPLVIDIKSLQVQLLSSRPATAIVREILRSISHSLDSGGSRALGSQITHMISE